VRERPGAGPVRPEDRSQPRDVRRLVEHEADLAVLVHRGRRQVHRADEGPLAIDEQQLRVLVERAQRADLPASRRQPPVDPGVVRRELVRHEDPHGDAAARRRAEELDHGLVADHLGVDIQCPLGGRDQLRDRRPAVERADDERAGVRQASVVPVGLEDRHGRGDIVRSRGVDAELAVTLQGGGRQVE
jgi:hypothetical protein